MTNKLMRDPSTLRLMRDSVTGKLMRAAPAGVGQPCSACPGSTPHQIRVTFTGVNNGCCVFVGTNIDCFLKVDAANLNDSWTLTQMAGYPCIWTATFEDAIDIAWYDGEGPPSVCSEEAYHSSGTGDLTITVNVTAGTIVASISNYTPRSGCAATPVSLFENLSLSPDSGYCVKQSGIANWWLDCAAPAPSDCITYGGYYCGVTYGGAANIVEL